MIPTRAERDEWRGAIRSWTFADLSVREIVLADWCVALLDAVNAYEDALRGVTDELNETDRNPRVVKLVERARALLDGEDK